MSGQADFLKALAKDPSLIDKIKKREELYAFKKEYNTEKATSLKCPACGTYLQWPGSLWFDKDDPTLCVCKKCRLVFKLICLTVPNAQLIEELREVAKGKGTLPSWLKVAEPKEANERD